MDPSKSINEQYIWTVKLNQDFSGNLSIDDLGSIDCYFDKTKMHPFIYHWIKEQCQQALTKNTPQEFEAVKRNFIHHLDQRIAALQLFIPEKKDRAQQTKSLGLESATKEKIYELDASIEMCLNLLDILFNCEEVIVHLPKETPGFVQNVLEKYIETTLPSFLNLIPQPSETIKFDFKNCFNNLKIYLSQSDFEKAQEQINIIRKDIAFVQRRTV